MDNVQGMYMIYIEMCNVGKAELFYIEIYVINNMHVNV